LGYKLERAGRCREAAQGYEDNEFFVADGTFYVFRTLRADRTALDTVLGKSGLSLTGGGACVRFSSRPMT
jgi:hypothetical protein